MIMLAKSVTILTALAAAMVCGQTTPTPPDAYASIIYLKVNPGSQAALEELANTTLRQIYGSLLKEPRTNFTGWNFSRITYRGLDEDAPTHISVAFFNGPPDPDFTTRYQAAVKKVTGAEPVELTRKMAALRQVVGTELFQGIAWAGSAPEGSFRVTYHSKAAPMRLAAAADNAASVWKPVYDAAVKEGAILAYTMGRAVFPRGDAVDHDLIYTITYKDLASAIKGYSVAPEMFRKIHPKMSYIGAVDQNRELRSIRKTFLSRLLSSVMAPSPVK
jgi:hypothetical protein